jgi:hypothetical protein
MLKSFMEDEVGIAKMNAYGVLVGSPNEKRPIRGVRCRLEDNARMDCRETCVRDWILQAQHGNNWQALVNTVINFRLP